MKRINVTEPFLPPLDEYVDYLRGIWGRNWLTNQGVLVQDFEGKLQQHHALSSPVHCVANGGLGLQLALKALGVSGEVITTPFSYVATSSCPLWEGCRLKFVDIEPDFLTLDPIAVEAAITPATEAILATHVFGNPCDVEALEQIASKHGIALIYDAAHAFGVQYKGRSLLEWGDASLVSLHATKLMHSVEGGFIVARDSSVSGKIEWMRRFGHNGPDDFHGVAINAKMSELHAAMGLCVLKHYEFIHHSRRLLSDAYDMGMPDQITSMRYRTEATRNFSYYPVLFESENVLLNTVDKLKDVGVFPRRYFYPLLHQIDGFVNSQAQCPVAESVVSRILCLPLFAGADVGSVSDLVLRQIKLGGRVGL